MHCLLSARLAHCSLSDECLESRHSLVKGWRSVAIRSPCQSADTLGEGQIARWS